MSFRVVPSFPEARPNRRQKFQDNLAIVRLFGPASGTGKRLSDGITKEFLFFIGVLTTAIQGGGIVFGATPFEAQLLKLAGSPFTSKTAGSVFAVGHNITAFGCILSGFICDELGPRICAVSGLILEAIGHLMMVYVVHLPQWAAWVGYGFIGLGGCQVLLAALAFTSAFQHAGRASALLTAAFSAGSWVFMFLTVVEWEAFFWFYVVLCLVGAIVTALLYPDAALPAFSEVEEDSDCADMARAMAENNSVWSVLFKPATVLFLLTFSVAGSGLLYGLSDFVAALQIKDDCVWDSTAGDFTSCKRQGFQDALNNYGMPFIGNFILPMSLFLGCMSDKYGYTLPAVINIASVQVFLVCLWVLPLDSTWVTVLVYNVANTAVFTLQNCYICGKAGPHIGKMFSISNLAIGLVNVVADYLATNPFGHGENAITESMNASCTFWIVACIPLYAWPVVEFWSARKVTRDLDDFYSVVLSDCGAALAGLPSFTMIVPPQQNQARQPALTMYVPTQPRKAHDVSVGHLSTIAPLSTIASRTASSGLDSSVCSVVSDTLPSPETTSMQRAAVPFLQVNDEESPACADPAVSTVLTNLNVISKMNSNNAPASHFMPQIAWSPVVKVNPPVWEAKVQKLLTTGPEHMFFVLDFDRTITKCYLEDGSRSLDCHDILASISKITNHCKQTMEALMNKYYPIEIHPTMTREEKIPHMVEWYTLVNRLLGSQNITKQDVEAAVKSCHNFRLRPGVEELFQIAERLSIPIVVLSAGLGNVIEEVIRQRVRRADGTVGRPWPNVRVLSNTLQWDAQGQHIGFSEPLIHMYNKSLQDAPWDVKDLIMGRDVGLLCGDGTGDLTMAQGHNTTTVMKFGFLNEKVEERLPKYMASDGFDHLILNDGTYESVLDIVRRIQPSAQPSAQLNVEHSAHSSSTPSDLTYSFCD